MFRCEIPRRGQPQEEKLPGLEKVTKEALNALNEIIDKFTEEYKLSKQDHGTREQTFTEVGDLVRRHMDPNIHPRLFGSSSNGLMLNTSDLDILLDVSNLGPVDPTHTLSDLAKHMKDNKLFVLDKILLQGRRIPIIKFQRTDNDVKGDISVGKMLVIRIAQITKTYNEIDERVRRLVLLVKAVSKVCCGSPGKNGGYLSSHAYTMMVIYFLQQMDPPVIPVLQEMNRPRDISVYEEEGWDTYFYSDIYQQTWPSENTDSVPLLALKFFKFFYEEFDYSKTVIAPKQKAHLSCTDKNWFRPINIEDPFNLDNNLGKQVSSKTLHEIKTMFRQAYLRYSVVPEEITSHTHAYYFDKQYLCAAAEKDIFKPPVYEF